MPTFRVMTYNVHSCVGTDGKLAPERIAEVIASAGVDVVALQEVDVLQSRTGRVNQPAWLAERLRMHVHFTSARACHDGHYGNAVLSRFPISVLSEGSLPRRRDEERAVQWLRLNAGGVPVNLINTHLSIHIRDRWLQIEQLMSTEWIAKVERHVPLVVCGDLNSTQFSPIYRRLRKDLSDAQRARGLRAATFPSRVPLVRLDHVFTSSNVAVLGCEVRRGPLCRVASDHLPVVAELSCHSAAEAA